MSNDFFLSKENIAGVHMSLDTLWGAVAFTALVVSLMPILQAGD